MRASGIYLRYTIGFCSISLPIHHCEEAQRPWQSVFLTPLGMPDIVAPYVIARERSDRGNPFSLADIDIPHVTEGERIATSGFALLAMT